MMTSAKGLGKAKATYGDYPFLCIGSKNCRSLFKNLLEVISVNLVAMDSICIQIYRNFKKQQDSTEDSLTA